MGRIAFDSQLIERIATKCETIPEQSIVSGRELMEQLFEQIECLAKKGYTLAQIHEFFAEEGMNLALDTFRHYYSDIKRVRERQSALRLQAPNHFRIAPNTGIKPQVQ